MALGGADCTAVADCFVNTRGNRYAHMPSQTRDSVCVGRGGVWAWGGHRVVSTQGSKGWVGGLGAGAEGGRGAVTGMRRSLCIPLGLA